MKKFILVFSILLYAFYLQAQVAINTTNALPNSSAMLDISSNNKGLLIPRLGNGQRTGIINPAKGLMVYDTTSSSMWLYNGKTWKELGGNSYNSDSNLIVGQQSGAIPSYNLTGFMSKSDSSGYLYDSGGPSGNYGNNEDYYFQINTDINQFAIDINVLNLSLESPYDSIVITDAYNNHIVLTGSTTGKFRFYSGIDIHFKSNGVNTQAGFAIRWNGIFTGSNNFYDSTQTTGWYFNPAKLSMRGGLNTNNNWSPDSSGRFSFSYGDDAQAKGTYAISMGNETKASGYEATAIGNFNLAGGSNSLALGSYTKANGSNATAMGYNTNASGSFSTAMGVNSSAAGYSATAIGSSVFAKGESSTSIGVGNSANGFGSMALGANTIANGNYSASLGRFTISRSYGGLTVGMYNDSTNAASQTNFNPLNRIFQIGNGTADNARSNAMTVLQNGNVGIGELNPGVPLNFASTLGDKISLYGNTGAHYGFGILNNLFQMHTDMASSDIAFGWGSSGSFNETMRIKGTGDGSIKGNFTVQNGKGLIRNTDGTQSKKLSALVTVNTSFTAGQTLSFAVTWPETFSAGNIEAYVGNVTSGAGGWAEVVMTLTNVTTTNAILYVYNPKTITVTPNFTIKIIAIGPQ